MKKNCYSCRFLDCEHGDDGPNDYAWGLACTKTDLFGKKESEMLRKMTRKTYLEKGKRCFEPKQEEGEK